MVFLEITLSRSLPCSFHRATSSHKKLINNLFFHLSEPVLAVYLTSSQCCLVSVFRKEMLVSHVSFLGETLSDWKIDLKR